MRSPRRRRSPPSRATRLLATRRLLRGDPAILKARMDEELRLFGEAVRSPQARAAFMAFMQKTKA